MKTIAVIGGGASGMAAAITASRILRNESKIILLERNSRVGKKLLSTGNGRCNLSNEKITEKNFQCSGGGLLNTVIQKCGVEKTLEFFADCGLKCKVTSGGRIYPYHEQASAVLDVLRFEIERLGVGLITEIKITGVEAKAKGGFKIYGETSKSKASYDCDKIIISTGGKAAPKTGSDGSGFELMSSFGHSVAKVTPALTQLKTDNQLTSSLSGIKINAALSIKTGNKILKHTAGEIIFTAYGLSGSAVFDISGAALATGGDVMICIDFLPELEPASVSEVLLLRRAMLGHLPLEEYFTGYINKRVGQALIKLVCGSTIGRKAAGMTDSEIFKLSRVLKNFELRIKGDTGWDNAQTNYGGLLSSEFDSETLESRLVPGLYATGELFGFAGECGGFNLQWAWSSGMVAGEAAAGNVREI